MANARRPIPPLRAYTAAVLGVFGLFVVSAGAGMADWSIVVLGLALMIFAASLVVVTAMRGGARAYVAGTAYVISASEPPASSAYGRCELHLTIDAPGVASAAVTVRDPRVPVSKWPVARSTLPIMVAVDDPRRVRIQWDDVPTHAEEAADEQAAGGYGVDYPEYPEYGVPASAGREEPATADLTETLADLHDEGRESAAGAPGTATPSAPPPRRPEASPEDSEEAYPVEGEAIFSPKAPPPAPDVSAAGAAGSPTDRHGTADGPASGQGPAGGDGPASSTAEQTAQAQQAQQASDSGRPPRPRPRPSSEEQVNGAEQVSPAAAGARRPAVTTADPDAEGSTDAGDGSDSRSTPSVTAIEFDLGELLTAPSGARPGRAGEIHGVGITLPVRDLGRSAEFYREVLGFHEIDGGDGNVVLASGDTRVVLRADPDASDVAHGTVDINLEVADVHAVYEELKAKGVRFTTDPRPAAVGERLEPWTATFRDPDGHGIAITQWRRRGG